jgi:1-acyl-sn-glycerol-3-phosphate acyltransferase
VTYILNAWAWTAAVLLVIVMFPVVAAVWVVTAPFDPGRYSAGRWFRRLAVMQVAMNPLWHFRTSGRGLPDPRRPYVVVSNHESYADIFLISHLPWEMKWLSKETIFKIPVMGWMMRMVGDVPIRRGERSSGVSALAACRDRLAKRVSVMIFPEGTRSPHDDMLPFKDGAFRLAIDAGVPILPLVVAGTRRAMAKGTFRFQHTVAEVRVLDPVETAGLTPDDVPALRERVRGIIGEARTTLRRDLEARTRA